MNISIGSSKKKAKKSKSTISYGLNTRDATAKKKTKNVFGDDDDDDDDESEDMPALSGRDRVNRQIAAEQAAIRKRALDSSAALSSQEASLYDYDGAYDSFNQHKKEDEAKKEKGTGERKSRYVEELLKTAKKRGHEREIILERKIAREQQAEDASSEYQGKDKFVTKAYKRKLEERRRWQDEEDQHLKKEEEDDVTKKSTGKAFGSFYGNFSKNVAMGGRDDQAPAKPNDDGNKEESQPSGGDSMADIKAGGGFLSGFERPKTSDTNVDEDDNRKASTMSRQAESTRPKIAAPPKLSQRQIREKKVAEARARYLERKRAVLQ